MASTELAAPPDPNKVNGKTLKGKRWDGQGGRAVGRQDAQGRICRAHRFSCDRGFICDMVVSTVIERRAVGWDGGVGALGYNQLPPSTPAPAPISQWIASTSDISCDCLGEGKKMQRQNKETLLG
ncbi:unnamed protein product [Boreogadus saida]